MNNYPLSNHALTGTKFAIDYEKELNDQQRAVVSCGPGPILVIAGAGSGKTRTLIYRVAWLVENGAPPESILLMTFTNKAAQEMLRRVSTLLNLDSLKIWGGTFHHIGNRMLRKFAKLSGFTSDFTIIDRDDSRTLMDSSTEAIIDKKARPKKFPRGNVLVDIYSYSVNTQQPLVDTVEQKYPYFMHLMEEIELILRKYSERKRKLNVLDFDDLLTYWKLLLEENESVRDWCGKRFSNILVDEYQDTSKIQGDIVDLIAKKNRNLMVVGDDAQSIFAFRGASFRNIIQFPERYPDAKTFKLEVNYRSSPQILSLANCSIACNARQFHKKLAPVKKEDVKPAVIFVQNAAEQAQFIGQHINELFAHGCNYGEIAVLYRAHWHSMEVQMELTRQGVPFVVRSGIRFFEQAHIKDVISYMKIIANPKDELSWKRILKQCPRIGAVSAEKIWNFLNGSAEPLKAVRSEAVYAFIPRGAEKGIQQLIFTIDALSEEGVKNSPSDMIPAVMEMGYAGYMEETYPNADARKEDLTQLSIFARQFASLTDFLSELALMTNIAGEEMAAAEAKEPSNDYVTLTTVHQAKGLEWKAVFVVWLADGKFPDEKSLGTSEDEEEERRLFYVAATRAKDTLFLMCPTTMQETNWDVVLKQSRFIKELDRDTYDEWQAMR